MKKAKEVDYRLNDQNIKKSDSIAYYFSLRKNILGFMEFEGLKLWEPDETLLFKQYEDEKGAFVYHRPYKFHPITDPMEEYSGFELDLQMYGRWTPELNLLMDELLHRVRWNAWPDSDYDPLPFGSKMKIEYCWHHTAIIHNQGFAEEEVLIIKLQGGYCYCS
jgi:hypothetical protein